MIIQPVVKQRVWIRENNKVCLIQSLMVVHSCHYIPHILLAPTIHQISFQTQARKHSLHSFPSTSKIVPSSLSQVISCSVARLWLATRIEANHRHLTCKAPPALCRSRTPSSPSSFLLACSRQSVAFFRFARTSVFFLAAAQTVTQRRFPPHQTPCTVLTRTVPCSG